MIHPLLQSCHLYGIIDLAYVAREALTETTDALLQGGIKILQLRAKNMPYDEVVPIAHQLREQCKNGNCLFIVNDYPELAIACKADGVHIGQDDGAIQDIRDLVGEGMIIGRSTHSFEQAIQAHKEKADYIGFGPLFLTQTKPGRPAIGLEDIKQVHETLPTDFPIFCIGGINETTLPQVQDAGAKRVVIVSWLLQQPDVQASTSILRKQLGEV